MIHQKLNFIGSKVLRDYQKENLKKTKTVMNYILLLI